VFRLDPVIRGLPLGRQEGQTLAEYAMILGLIVIVVMTVVALLGTNISKIFSSVAHSI
jgi:Flp pilus assembly pilin Flp